MGDRKPGDTIKPAEHNTGDRRNRESLANTLNTAASEVPLATSMPDLFQEVGGAAVFVPTPAFMGGIPLVPSALRLEPLCQVYLLVVPRLMFFNQVIPPCLPPFVLLF
jgi:hypothetical protein